MAFRESKIDDQEEEEDYSIKDVRLKHDTQRIDVFMKKKQVALEMFEKIKDSTEIVLHVAHEYGAEWDNKSGQKLREQATRALEKAHKSIADCKKGINTMKRQTNKLKRERDKSAQLKNQIQGVLREY